MSNIRCVVVGESNRAGSTRDKLDAQGVPTRAIAHNFARKGIVATCEKESGLNVVAVYCRDFPMDMGAGLFRDLRATLGKSVSLHALMEAPNMDDAKARLADCDVDEITFAYPFTPESAMVSIRQNWFNGGGAPAKSARAGSSTVRQISPAKGRVFGVPTPAPLPVKGGNGVHIRTHVILDEPVTTCVSVPKPEPKAAVPAEPKAAVKRPRIEAVDTTKLFDSIPVFSMTLLKPNATLPDEPIAVCIVGKNGTVVELDPRRVKPLPGQPRSEDSPGFAEESILALGRGILATGQLDEVMVCPIVGDEKYDAQLIDGERRQRSALLSRRMLKATVREDVTADEVLKLYLLSVVRNTQKHPHTTREYMRMVSRLRGSDYNMTREQTAQCLDRSIAWVSQMERLNSLHPDVQSMIGEASPDDRDDKRRELTSQIALLLIDVEPDRQLAAAKHIIANGMNYVQARFYVINLRRGLGMAASTTGRRKARQFDSLRTLVQQSLVRIETYLLAPTIELHSDRRTAEERAKLASDLRTLAAKLTQMSERIEELESV